MAELKSSLGNGGSEIVGTHLKGVPQKYPPEVRSQKISVPQKIPPGIHAFGPEFTLLIFGPGFFFRGTLNFWGVFLRNETDTGGYFCGTPFGPTLVKP